MDSYGGKYANAYALAKERKINFNFPSAAPHTRPDYLITLQCILRSLSSLLQDLVLVTALYTDLVINHRII